MNPTSSLVLAPGEIADAAPAASRTDRRVGLDAVRVLAVYSIVWIHAVRSERLAPTTVLGRFAVPFFVAAAVWLIVERLAEQPARRWLQYARTRTRRLLLPFAAWTLVYWLLKVVKKRLAPDEPNDLPGWEMILLGSAFHLWFLPFLWAVSLAVFAFGQRVIARGRHETAAACCWTLGIAIALVPGPTTVTAWDGLSYMWLALPAVCWSFALSLLMGSAANSRCGPALRWTALLALMAATWMMRHDERTSLAENLAGLSCLLLALALPVTQVVTRIGRWAPLAYGIYLSHLLFLKVGESVVSRWSWPVSPVTDVGLFAFAAIAGTLVAWSLSRRPATRWLLG